MPTFRLSSPSRRVVAVLTAGVLACGAGAVAVADRADDTSGRRIAEGVSGRSPESVSPSLSESFSVFSRPGRAVPAAVSEALAAAPQYQTAFAPNASLAQELPQVNPDAAAGHAWLVPGDDALCLYLPDTEGAAMTCATTDEARTGKLFVALSAFGRPTLLVGVLPDGASSARVENRDGSTQPLTVTANSYSIRSDHAQTVVAGGRRISMPPVMRLPKVPANGQGDVTGEPR